MPKPLRPIFGSQVAAILREYQNGKFFGKCANSPDGGPIPSNVGPCPGAIGTAGPSAIVGTANVSGTTFGMKAADESHGDAVMSVVGFSSKGGKAAGA